MRDELKQKDAMNGVGNRMVVDDERDVSRDETDVRRDEDRATDVSKDEDGEKGVLKCQEGEMGMQRLKDYQSDLLMQSVKQGTTE